MWRREPIPPGLRIIAEYSTFVVVEKPGALLSVPGRGPDKQDCVISRFLELYPDAIPHPSVHRLDMETSGLMVIARTKAAHRALSIQFINRVVTKRYFAVVDGVVKEKSGRIELAFRLDVEHRPWQMYDPENGKLGITEWKNLGVENGSTRIEFNPLTGRTHQLRLHASHELGLGFPIIGDTLYGTGKDYFSLQLHAADLAFDNPDSGERLVFHSEVPFFRVPKHIIKNKLLRRK